MTRFTVDLDTPDNVALAKRAIDRAFTAGGMIAEFSDLIELIQSFAAKEGIDLKEPAQNETGKAA